VTDYLGGSNSAVLQDFSSGPFISHTGAFDWCTLEGGV